MAFLKIHKRLFEAKKRKEDLRTYNEQYKSDKRISGGVTDVCVLCHEEKKLMLSHIVPRWAYHWAKKEGEGHLISDYPSIGINLKQQDGSKHYLLCAECEQYLGDSENYVKCLMHGSMAEKARVGITEKGDCFSGIDFRLIQRFAFGLVIKSHYCSSAPFHKIHISSNTLDFLKKEIFNPSLDDSTYPIVALRFYSKVHPKIDPKAIMIPSHSKLKDGSELVSILMAGWEWDIFFNPNKQLERKKELAIFAKWRLVNKKPFYVPWSDIIDQRFIKNKILKNERKDGRNK